MKSRKWWLCNYTLE